VFAALCSTSATQELSLQLSDTTHKEWEALVATDVRLVSAAIESQQFTHLRRIELRSDLICGILPDISQFVQTHAATLEALNLQTIRGSELPDASATRAWWKPLLQRAAECEKLSEVLLFVSNKDDDEYDVDIDVECVEAVAARLAKLIVSPTEPGEELGWIE
jgi:hypothetical protein